MVTFQRFDAVTASTIVDDLVAVQQEIYPDAEPRQFFSEDRYRRQLSGGRAEKAYAVAAMVPALAGSGWLLVAG